MIFALSCLALAVALVPTILTLLNLPQFTAIQSSRTTFPQNQHPENKNHSDNTTVPSVSILIPARDEAGGIDSCLRNALNNKGIQMEILVLDDHSTDNTAERVHKWSQIDPRVKLLGSQPLPEGWNGKQFACHQLSQTARYDYFLFIDADVRLKPSAIYTLLCYQQENEIALLSAFPRQEMETWLEKWLIPMMHLILLGYLPFQRMRSNADPAYAAGCGQVFLTHRTAYDRSGGHTEIRGSRHDGITLPRIYRQSGLRTDVVDGTELATCRMYHRGSEVIRGVLKNAHEGIAKPKLIGLFTLLLLGGTLLPGGTLTYGIQSGTPSIILLSGAALLLSHATRLILAIRFKQSHFATIFHLPAITLFVSLQWIALILHRLGQTPAWRGRF